jgi:uncharacterized protein (DUF433 family)
MRLRFPRFSSNLPVVKKKIVSSDPEVMGGTPCFTGTRVPFQTLMDYLEAGDPIGEFLENFPSVKRRQVISFLHEAAEHFITALTNGHDRDLKLGRNQLARLNRWADKERRTGRTRVYEYPADYVAHTRARRTAKGKSR